MYKSPVRIYESCVESRGEGRYSGYRRGAFRSVADLSVPAWLCDDTPVTQLLHYSIDQVIEASREQRRECETPVQGSGLHPPQDQSGGQFAA